MSVAMDALDGLVLGGGRVCAAGVVRVPCRHPAYPTWLRDELALFGWLVRAPSGGSRWLEVEALGTERWARGVPPDVRLSARTLAYWFAGSGRTTTQRYALVLGVSPRWGVAGLESLAHGIAVRWGWAPRATVDRGRLALRFARSVDRLGLRACIASFVPPCFAPMLDVRVSRPSIAPAVVREARERCGNEEGVRAVARKLGLSPAHVSRIARRLRRAGD